MISKLFSSGSTEQLRKDTIAQVDAILKELEHVKKENKLLTELVSDQQLTLNIIIAANQAMSEDINSIYALLGAQKSGNSSKYFKFTFNSSEDDDLPN